MLHTLEGLEHMALGDFESFLDKMYSERKDAKAPTRVKPVPRFEDNMIALRDIFDRPDPPCVPIRSSEVTLVLETLLGMGLGALSKARTACRFELVCGVQINRTNHLIFENLKML